MPIFEYTARDMAGNKLTGKIESSSRSQALDELSRGELVPISVKRSRPLADFLPVGRRRIKKEEIIIFSRQLMTMLKAGIGLLSCLHSLRKQAENPDMKKTIDEIYTDVSEGSSLSEALSKHAGVFNDVYVSMIRVGEEGGVLDEVLNRLVILLEHEAETRAALKQAVRYPAMVIIGLAISFVVAVVFVLPKFSSLYSRYEADLPLPTRILLGFNDAVNSYGLWIGISIVIVIFFILLALRTEAGKRKWDEYKLVLPVLGPLFVKIAVTRFARMFATLDKCGLPILRNLEIVAETVGNLVIAQEIMRQRESVRAGKSVAEPIKDSRYFPPLVSEMIMIGEASGSMEEALNAVSDHYDREISYAVKNMTTLIEPIITLIMGVFVLFMAVAVFLPMWKMSSVIRK
ncbi:MAG: type II secretion system F family protein [Candidatus Glassbacteria bacterium]